LLILKIRAATKSHQILFAYFVLSAVTEIILLLMQSKGINNMAVINVFSLLQFALLSAYLLKEDTGSKRQLYLLVLAVIVFIVCCVHFIFLNPAHKFDYVALTFENIFLTLISALILTKFAKQADVILLENPGFWFSSAIFLYFSVSVAITCSADILFDDQTYLRKYTWFINSLLTISSNILYITGLFYLCKRRN
jgi:hypothetical protein